MANLVPSKFDDGSNLKPIKVNDMVRRFFSNSETSSFTGNKNFRSCIKETSEGYIIYANLPGVRREEINIVFNNNYVTISAIRSSDNETIGRNFMFKQICFGRVSRSFYVENVDMNSMKSIFEEGVLIMILPKIGKYINTNNKVLIE